MNTLTSDEKRLLLPSYSIESIEKHMVNPYREFAYYCLDNLYPKTENMTSLSIKDFAEMIGKDPNGAFELFSSKIKEVAPSVSLELDATAGNASLLKAFVKISGTNIGFVNFYSASSIGVTNPGKDDIISGELVIDEFDGFDFLEMNRKMNVFVFSKDHEDKRVMDLIIAFFAGLDGFLEFVRSYKAKQLITKNIDMFVKKFIEPYVLNTIVQFRQDKFMIAALCGDRLLRQTYEYKDYLKSIQEFGAEIQRLFGTKFKDMKDAAAAAKEEQKQK